LYEAKGAGAKARAALAKTATPASSFIENIVVWWDRSQNVFEKLISLRNRLL
jgi:hypothetical protein